MHAGYIIGRGVRVVEWDVAEHPDKPDGDLASMKLRALTPDGIRMAIAKEYGLSNYREVMLGLTQLQMERCKQGCMAADGLLQAMIQLQPAFQSCCG